MIGETNQRVMSGKRTLDISSVLDGERTPHMSLYYCDSMRNNQKGGIERAHTTADDPSKRNNLYPSDPVGYPKMCE